MDTFFCDQLIETLKALVCEFAESIAEHAVNLCDKLSQTYIDQMGCIDLESDDTDPQVVQTIIGCLTAINRIIDSVGSQERVRDRERIIESIQG